MTLRRKYKRWTKIDFKWWIDYYNCNFVILNGVIDGQNSFLNQVVVYDEKNDKWYTVRVEDIVKVYET